MHADLKQPVAIVMTVLAAFVFVAVFEAPPQSRPFFPGLVPVFGVPFGLVFAAAQVGFCLLLRLKKGLVLLAVVWIIAAPLVLVFSNAGLTEHAMSTPARAVTGPACASGLALGIAILTGRL